MKFKQIVRKTLIVLGVSLLGLLCYYLLWDIFAFLLSKITGADIHTETAFGMDFSIWEFLTDFLAAIVVFTAFILVYWHFIRRAEDERDKYRIQVLESQMSPHFLLNATNVLANLIETNPNKATDFLLALTKINNYLISNIGHDVMSLQEELELMTNYFAVMRERFGECIFLNIAPNVSQLQGSLPIATLQMLVENAIKHNEHTLIHPLTIEVMGNDQYITVSNRKQPIVAAVSTHLGQHNITERYRLLTPKKVIISDTEDKYSVSIPLIHQKS